jgi:hypothetical protein
VEVRLWFLFHRWDYSGGVAVSSGGQHAEDLAYAGVGAQVIKMESPLRNEGQIEALEFSTDA